MVVAARCACCGVRCARYNKPRKLTSWSRPKLSTWYTLPEAVQSSLLQFDLSRETVKPLQNH
jgi:hypothetical protein